MPRLRNRLKADEGVLARWLDGTGGVEGDGYLRAEGRTLYGRVELHQPFAPVASLTGDGLSARVTMGENLLNQETHEYLLEQMMMRCFNLDDWNVVETLHDGQPAECLVAVEVERTSLYAQLLARRPMSEAESRRRFAEAEAALEMWRLGRSA
jgi:hypothetical protein